MNIKTVNITAGNDENIPFIKGVVYIVYNDLIITFHNIYYFKSFVPVKGKIEIFFCVCYQSEGITLRENSFLM